MGEAWTLPLDDLRILESLLARFRDTAVDREEYDKRESLRFDVGFEIGMVKENEASEKPIQT